MKPCNQCGKCCIAYADGGLTATAEEIDWWETARPQIAAYVNNGEIWTDPETKTPLKSCPWLVSNNGHAPFSCSIYEDRPADCRHYPVNIDEMARDECEMLEPWDLKNPLKAQQKLDVLMIDSRPPLQNR